MGRIQDLIVPIFHLWWNPRRTRTRQTRLKFTNMSLSGIFAQTWFENISGYLSTFRLQVSPKQAYLFLCLNLFFLLAHGLSAVLTLPCADEGDAAAAELFCLVNIFSEPGFGAAASPTCGGIPELQQMDCWLHSFCLLFKYLRLIFFF